MSDSMAHDAHAIAEAVKLGMFMDDAASRGLGMHIEAIGPGYSRIAMTVRPDMLNGFKICHGGFVTTLADSAFAFACNSYNEVTVASGIVVDFLAPAHEGDRLVAECHEVARTGSRRSSARRALIFRRCSSSGCAGRSRTRTTTCRTTGRSSTLRR